MIWLEILGWVGTILVVYSLTQARVLRFRWLNFAGAVLATFYNGWLGIWPFFAMNAAIAVIDAYWLIRLYREAHDATVYEVVEVAPEDTYLQHILQVHHDDIASTHPGFSREILTDPRRLAVWLVVRGDETVGVVVVRESSAQHEAIVELDWVSPRFRDFTPGEFVYRDSGIFLARGLQRIVQPNPPHDLQPYLHRVGFTPDADATTWSRPVSTPPR